MNHKLLVIVGLGLLLLANPSPVWGEPVPLPEINLNIGQGEDPQQVVDSLRLLVLLSVLALAPAILMMLTSFTRIIIVLSFVRTALASQQTPPNQVLIGLALFLTLFVMAPTWSQLRQDALEPYLNETITQEEAFQRAEVPLKQFMMRQTREKDLALFVAISGEGQLLSRDQVSMVQLIPAFIISELKTAFQMGFLLYIPFLIIDMVVASTLMSMGMFMLPPVMISLPFKLLLFVMVDGWNLVVKSLVESF